MASSSGRVSAPPRKKFIHGLNIKVCLLFIILSMFVFLCFGVYDYISANRTMRQDLDQAADMALDRLAKQLADSVWKTNWDEASAVLLSEMRDRNLARAVFHDSLNKENSIGFARNNDWRPIPATELAPAWEIRRRVEVVNQGERLGLLELLYTDRFIKVELRRRLLAVCFRTLLLETILVVCLYAFLKWLFIDPVLDLCRTAREVAAKKDFSIRAGPGGRDEIGLLRRNFNSMLAEIESKDSQLKAYSGALEKKVRERTMDLAEKARELEQANKWLQELDGLKSILISSVSHELRTPLTSILGFAKLILRDFDRHFNPLTQSVPQLAHISGRIRQNLNIIGGEGERLTRLVNDVLDLNKIESGRMRWHDAPIRPDSFMLEAAKAVSGDFEGRGEIEFRVQLPSDSPSYYLDKDKMVQVLVNLLNNAAKFTSQGSVELRGSIRPDKTLMIEVADTGKGIPKEFLKKIFDQFQQVDDTLEDKPKGTGLGLAICRQIINHYEGRIWAESIPGKGSRFIFTIPPPPPFIIRQETGLEPDPRD